MGVSFTDIDSVCLSIGVDNENRLFVPADAKTFPLADCIELGAFVLTENLAVWVILVTGLFYMLFSAFVDLCLE